MIIKFQDGGAVNQEQQAFTAYLIKILNPKDQKDFEDQIAQLSEEQINKLYQEYKSMENQIELAKMGTKLDYLKTLKGECPEGYEKFKMGGCVKCAKKKQGDTINLVKEDMKKCGGKMKKRVTKKVTKKEEGGILPEKDRALAELESMIYKCGGKMKKKKRITKNEKGAPAPRIKENGVPFNKMGNKVFERGPADGNSTGSSKPNSKQKSKLAKNWKYQEGGVLDKLNQMIQEAVKK